MRNTVACVALGTAIPILLAVTEAAADAPDSGQDKDKEGIHVDVVPFVGGDSDIGWGVGLIGDVTNWKKEESRTPYTWRLEGSLFGTLRVHPLGVGYQDHWLRLILPDVGHGIRVEIRPSFTMESNVHYFGLGNAAPAPAPGGNPDPSSMYYEYGRTHPELLILVRKPLVTHWDLILGNQYSQNYVDISAYSKLNTDLHSGTPEVRALLDGARSGPVNLFQAGLAFDTRDSEIVTHHGTNDELTVRASPGIGPFPYSFGEALLSFSAFIPFGSRVVIAGRLLGDGLIGQPPLWQLSNYSSTSAIGGTLGVRGVPAQRYYGKIKALENLEARVEVWTFHTLKKDWTLATAAFFDAGRVWADWTHAASLDGSSVGIHWGVGGGLRLEQGTGLVVRADLAWSPDALPVAGYFAAGETF